MDPNQFEQLISALNSLSQTLASTTWLEVLLSGGLAAVLGAIFAASVAYWLDSRREASRQARKKRAIRNGLLSELRLGQDLIMYNRDLPEDEYPRHYALPLETTRHTAFSGDPTPKLDDQTLLKLREVIQEAIPLNAAIVAVRSTSGDDRKKIIEYIKKITRDTPCDDHCKLWRTIDEGIEMVTDCE